MGWARLDDGWHDHPKVIAAGIEAAGLWVMCLTWAYKARRSSKTPGVIPEPVIQRFAGRKARGLVLRLHGVGLLDDKTEAGWPIHDFVKYLPKYDPEQASKAGRKGAAARHGKPLGEPPTDPYDEPHEEPSW